MIGVTLWLHLIILELNCSLNNAILRYLTSVQHFRFNFSAASHFLWHARLHVLDCNSLQPSSARVYSHAEHNNVSFEWDLVITKNVEKKIKEVYLKGFHCQSEKMNIKINTFSSRQWYQAMATWHNSLSPPSFLYHFIFFPIFSIFWRWRSTAICNVQAVFHLHPTSHTVCICWVNENDS